MTDDEKRALMRDAAKRLQEALEATGAAARAAVTARTRMDEAALAAGVSGLAVNALLRSTDKAGAYAGLALRELEAAHDHGFAVAQQSGLYPDGDFSGTGSCPICE